MMRSMYHIRVKNLSLYGIFTEVRLNIIFTGTVLHSKSLTSYLLASSLCFLDSLQWHIRSYNYQDT